MANPIGKVATQLYEVVLKTVSGEDLVVSVKLPVGTTPEQAVAAVQTQAPNLVQFFDGAVSPDGLAQLTHWANKPLNTIDPQQQLTGLSRRSPEANRLKGPDAAPPRSYYGVEANQNPYKREQGLGSVKHTAQLDAAKLYDAQANTGGLWGGGATNSEKAVKDAGYSGYYMDHPKLGKVAVVFDPLTAQQLDSAGVGIPKAVAGTAGATLLASAMLTPQEAEAAWTDPALAAVRKVYQGTKRSMAHEKAVTRGAREHAKGGGRLTAAETKAITDSVNAEGGSVKEALAVARKFKERHPTSGVDSPWAPYEIGTVEVKKDKEGKITGYSAKPKKQPYAYNTDPKTGKAIKKGSPRYNKMVRGVANDIIETARKAEAGDPAAQKVMENAGWYQNVQNRLGGEYGSFMDLFGDLLGATSPNTPVSTNFKFSREILERFSRGDFDETVRRYDDLMTQADDVLADLARREEAVKAVKSPTLGALRKTPEYKAADEAAREVMEDQVKASKAPTLGQFKASDEYQALEKQAADLKAKAREDVVRQTSIHPETGELKQYGINSENATIALADRWRTINKGSAPKAKNFSGNLVGFSKAPTIDVWAARNLRRNAGLKPIPSAGEQGVTGNVLDPDTFTSGGEFGLGQDVVTDATALINKELGMDLEPRDVQALQWFVEKDLWSKNNWTSAAGEGGSFETMMDLAPTESLTMGTSRAQNMDTQGVDFDPTAADQAALSDDVMGVFNADPDTVASKAQTTEGYYKGDPETSFDIDVVSKQNEMNTEGMDRVAQWAVDDSQESIYAARRIEDELGHARPGDFSVGTELMFERPVEPGGPEITKALGILDANGIEGATVIRDPRSGAPIGIRYLDIPEFSADPEKYATMSAENYGGYVSDTYQKFASVGDELAAEVPGVRSATPGYFDINVKSKEAAAEYLAQRQAPGADLDALTADFWGFKPAQQRIQESVAPATPAGIPAGAPAARPGAAPVAGAVAGLTGLAGAGSAAAGDLAAELNAQPPAQAQPGGDQPSDQPLQGFQFDPNQFEDIQVGPQRTPEGDGTMPAPLSNYDPETPYDPQGDPLLQAMAQPRGSEDAAPPGFLELVGDMFTGNLRETRATQELPELQDSGLLSGEDMGLAARLTPAMLSAMEPREIADILQSNFPNIGIQQDEKGNILAANNKTGARAVINKPGWSTMDTMQALGLAAAYTPAARTAQGARFLPRVGQLAGQNMATGAGLEGLQALSGGQFDEETLAWDAALGAVEAVPIVKSLRGLYDKVVN